VEAMRLWVFVVNAVVERSQWNSVLHIESDEEDDDERNVA
jgi:hypothetical protein